MKFHDALIRAARVTVMAFVGLIGPAQPILSLADLKVLGSVYLFAAISAVNVGLISLLVNLGEENTRLNFGPKG